MKLKLFLLLFLVVSATQLKAQTGFPFDNEVREFKHADSLNMPKPGGILFIGSSSIRLWSDLEQRFVGKPIIKRGLGGSQLWQWVKYYTPYVVYPYQPEKIFLYAGENDIADGRSGKQVAEDFENFWKLVSTKLPHTEFYFLAIKPSPSRAKFFSEVNTANSLIKESIKGKRRTHFIDVASVILDEKTGQPDSSLFKQDMLHLNTKGYDKWQRVIEKYIK
ncbi:hypothetical protein EOD41_13940 [Mucilaginibacter limnophilus]|uniref:SGNH hydrolase-type esterase domain-containing protein n=1 Tax=Mucilaginibacter limnophilus TaxID=1932778 RepID=A0A437MQX4_9SPHI|nr:GDSL-type esterase/lipase family protein [Mucilaginibacter limnophilus]RVU00057.1 hypothetical protein EOD41_13940 [Mucilaginibacter limnophilus]